MVIFENMNPSDIVTEALKLKRFIVEEQTYTTSILDTKEKSYVFFLPASGMGAGDGQRLRLAESVCDYLNEKHQDWSSK